MYRGGRWRSHSRWHGRTPYGRAAGVQHGRTATTGVRHGGNGGGGEGGVAMRAGASEMSSGKRLSADAVTTRPWPRGLKTASSKPSARAPSPWACAVVVTCFQFLSVILVCAWWQNSGGNIVLVLGVLRTLSLRHGKSHSNPRVREYAIIRVSFRMSSYVKHSRFLSVQASLGPYGKVRSWSSSLRQALLSLLLLTQSFVD